MTPSEEAYNQCEATPEEIAEAQALNPDLKPEQIAEKNSTDERSGRPGTMP
jgi:hypothetical protein